MTHLSLFSGIGGIDLAAEWAGFETVAFVEREPFCQKVLAKHWPEVPIYDDITTFNAEPFRGITLVSGGFPCQDISQTGKQEGLTGKRSGLWFEMLRVIIETRPAWVVAENVGALVRMGIDVCLAGLEAEGYTTRTVVFPACSIGAVHRRDRCFIIAHCDDTMRERRDVGSRVTKSGVVESVDDRDTSEPGLEGVETAGAIANTDARNSGSCGLQGKSRRWTGQEPQNRYSPVASGDWRTWSIKPVIRRGDDGFSDRVDRLKSLGNAVVPQQVYPILAAIAKEIGAMK